MRRIRPYEAADAQAVARFLTESAAVDATLEPITEAEWRAFAGRSFNRGAQDFAVVEEGGGMVGLLTSTRLEAGDPPLRHFRIIVHPGCRRRGVGSELLARVESQDTDPRVVLQCNAPESWSAGRVFLERRGFRRVRRNLEMERTGPEPPSPASVERVAIRPYRAGAADDAAWRALHARGYRDDPEAGELTAGDLAGFRDTAGFGLWFAESGGVAVGLCHVEDDGRGAGRIESLVVDAAARRRGIGRALLRTALRHVHRRGIDRVTLWVLAANEPAVRLYRSEGFEVRESVATWWREPGG